jgi:hypothetical protein
MLMDLPSAATITVWAHPQSCQSTIRAEVQLLVTIRLFSPVFWESPDRYANCCNILEVSIIATVTAFDQDGFVSHSDTRSYPDTSFLWEHIGCQQNNRRTVRVHVETEEGLEYEVQFSHWTRSRRYAPSKRFRALLKLWSDQNVPQDDPD